MLAGHYGASFAGKAGAPAVPLWVLFGAAQLVDLAHFVLLLLGVERTRLDFTLPSNPLVIEYVPYTHSLVANALWALAAGLVARAVCGATRPAVVIALVVLSHWFLDLPMHRGDLSLAGDPGLGFALWNTPWLASCVEFATLGAGVAAYLLAVRPPPPQRRAALILAAVLVAVQVYAIAVPPPPTIELIAASLLATQLALIGLAAWLERRAARA